MKVNIGLPVVRMDGREVGRSVCGHVITNFSGMGRFTKLWGSAPRALRYIEDLANVPLHIVNRLDDPDDQLHAFNCLL